MPLIQAITIATIALRIISATIMWFMGMQKEKKGIKCTHSHACTANISIWYAFAIHGWTELNGCFERKKSRKKIVIIRLTGPKWHIRLKITANLLCLVIFLSFSVSFAKWSYGSSKIWFTTGEVLFTLPLFSIVFLSFAVFFFFSSICSVHDNLYAGQTFKQCSVK